MVLCAGHDIPELDIMFLTPNIDTWPPATHPGFPEPYSFVHAPSNMLSAWLPLEMYVYTIQALSGCPPGK
jgi:hypothetical protein